ncbi:Uncharacterized protein Mb0978c [Geodia barretti]|uniref:Uncharacterized protein Mb0978c n=1 Tax=Geodia barretti TaxID=519541 RepID=A0AA35SYE7_GEOBA|nr:Uncharacterized protein Mb0978c [Geodia barretti]
MQYGFCLPNTMDGDELSRFARKAEELGFESAKIFASLDVLSKGRAVCGVGVGWLEKEFETLDVPYSERGPMTNEWLEIFTNLWSEQEPAYSGQYYSYDGIFFEPKPVQQPRIPIWVGGHTRPRTATHCEVRRRMASFPPDTGVCHAQLALFVRAG